MVRRSIQRSGGKRRQAQLLLRLPAGVKLFDSNRPSRRLYLLRSGRVRLSSNGEAILDHLAPGDFLGEESLLRRSRPRQTALSVSPVEVACLRQSELLDQLQHNRRFALQLLKNLALRMGRYEGTIRDFVVEGTEARLARLLCRLAPSEPPSGWVRLPFTVTNPEFARMIGTTRWRVSHFLHHFQQLGWLRFEQGIWVNREGLATWLSQRH